MVQALRTQADEGTATAPQAWPHGEREGLLAAADSLVDAINAAAHVLRGSASDDRAKAGGD